MASRAGVLTLCAGLLGLGQACLSPPARAQERGARVEPAQSDPHGPLTGPLGAKKNLNPETPTRVAVWSPLSAAIRPDVGVDVDTMAEVADALQERGVAATLLRVDQLSDPSVLNWDAFEALILPGAAYPLAAEKNILAFARKGGVVIGLGHGTAPLVHPVTPTVNGQWTANPDRNGPTLVQPRLLGNLTGLWVFTQAGAPVPYASSPAPGGVPSIGEPVEILRETAAHQTVTSLGSRFLPAAPDVDIRQELPVLRPLPLPRMRPGGDEEAGTAATGTVPTGTAPDGVFTGQRWDAPPGGPRLYPLMRASTAGGRETIPPLFILINGPYRSVWATSPEWTRWRDNPGWALGRETLWSLAEVARMLATGSLEVTDADTLPWRMIDPAPKAETAAPATVNGAPTA